MERSGETMRRERKFRQTGCRRDKCRQDGRGRSEQSKGSVRGGCNEDAAVRSDNRDGDVKETKKGREVGEMVWRRDEGVRGWKEGDEGAGMGGKALKNTEGAE